MRKWDLERQEPLVLWAGDLLTDTEHLWGEAEQLFLLVQDEAGRQSSKYELGEDRKEGSRIFCFLILTSSIPAGCLCLWVLSNLLFQLSLSAALFHECMLYILQLLFTAYLNFWKLNPHSSWHRKRNPKIWSNLFDYSVTSCWKLSQSGLFYFLFLPPPGLRLWGP